MKSIKLSIIAAMLATGLAAEDVTMITGETGAEATSAVEFSGNMALTTNYIWRGMSQTLNSPAIQGGYDLGYKGFYAGIWASNVNFGDGADSSAEFDLYAGYAGEYKKVSYEVGYVQYAYPNASTALNFAEAYAGLGYDFDVLSVSAMYYLGVKTNDYDPDNDYEFSVSVPLPSEFTADATYGVYENMGNYYYVGVTRPAFGVDFTLAYTGMSYDDSESSNPNNLVFTIGSSF
jgi:uncharacterized protein (TIGR02001 family)